jgi:hypothetical protein
MGNITLPGSVPDEISQFYCVYLFIYLLLIYLMERSRLRWLLTAALHAVMVPHFCPGELFNSSNMSGGFVLVTNASSFEL